MKSHSLQAAALVALGLALGWLLPRTGEAEAGTTGGQVMAVVGNAEITREDVAEHSPQEFEQLSRQEYDLASRYLDRAIEIKLVEVEAEARGMSPADLIKMEVDDQLPEPSADDVAAFFDDRSLEEQGTLEELAPRIEEYLTQQARNQRYSEFLGELRTRYPAEWIIQPPRTEIAADGFPAKGPDDAAVTIVEFADFQCPYCKQIIRPLDQVRQAYGDHVRLVYRHLPLTGIHPDAQKSAEASMCADEQGRFWEMHDAMFEDQQALGVDDLKRTARSLGLDGPRFDDCLDTDTYVEEVEVDFEAARELGLTGTPALYINGRFLNGLQSFDDLAAIIDDELERAGIVFERQPLRTLVAADGFPAKGPADAPVTIVEFADFQCPFCYELIDAVNEVLEAYPDQVRFVYRQFPLTRIHPHAQKAAEASLCGEEQGRFWEMHDALFADQLALDVAGLKETARSLGLDGPRFDECLDSGRFEQAVVADFEEGRSAGVTGTPALFINGRFLSGVQRFEGLSEVIEDELRRASQ